MELSLQVVSQVLECTAKGWTYRFFVDKSGVHVNRAEEDRPVWSHAILVQVYDIKQRKFLPRIRAGALTYFEDLSTAISTIQQLIEDESCVIKDTVS